MPRRKSCSEIQGFSELLWSLNALYCAVWHHFEASAFAPLPEHGPAILVANHTSGVDPMLLQASCRRRLGFLIAREFYEFWAFHWICKLLGCIPVRRDGHDLAATRAALRALEEGRIVPIFPEGRIVPKSGREFGEAKPGVAFIILHSRVPVIPAYIWGTPPTNQITKAMLTPSCSNVRYGPAIDLSDIPAGSQKDREVLAEVTERLMAAIHSLRAEVAGDQQSSLPPKQAIDDARRPQNGLGVLPGEYSTALRA
jgi:1-acyl-sn-glycerol-3-phosphate acyltransferase